MRRTVIALLLLLCGAAAALAQPAPAKQNRPKTAGAKQAATKQVPAQNGNCVGVVSNLGAKFGVSKIGFTVFGNEENEVPIESWRVDDLVVAKIGGLLGKRTAVRRVPYSKEAFAPLETPKLFPPKLYRDYETDAREVLRTIAVDTRCARYVVITPSVVSYGTTNQTLSGLGIVSSKAPFFTADLYNLHMVAWLGVYDGETFAVLTRKFASLGQPNFLATIGSPHREVDKSFWPESPDKAAQDAKLREAIRELVGQTMDATLPELKLTE
jgi:hypothetical protein